MRIPISLVALGVAFTLVGSAATTARSATTDNAGGGKIITVSLGQQSSVRSAAVAMLGRLHSALGARPSVMRAAQSTDSHSIALVFTVTHNGHEDTGVTLVDAQPGVPASGAALIDTTARFTKTLPSMLRRLETLQHSAPAPLDRVPAAPAEALIAHPFPDGTGSIGVPADWTLRVGGGGSALAVGPTGRETMFFNFTQSALEPSGVMGQMLENGTGIYPSGPLREGAMKSIVLLHDSGDPVDAWTHSWGQMAKQAGRSGPTFVVRQVKHTGPHTAFVSGNGMYGDKKTPFCYYAYLNVGPLSRTGQWGMYFSYVIVPTTEVSKQAATASAVLASVKINFGTLNASIAETARSFDQLFQSQIANDRALDAARQESTNASIARQDANQDAMQKQAAGMENYVLNRSVVGTETGAHLRVDNDLAAALVDSNPNFHVLRPSELVNGVDY